jgi:hypothetical protein
MGMACLCVVRREAFRLCLIGRLIRRGMRVRVSRLNNGFMVRCMPRVSSMGVWFFHIRVPQSMRSAAPGVIVLRLEGN